MNHHTTRHLFFSTWQKFILCQCLWMPIRLHPLHHKYLLCDESIQKWILYGTSIIMLMWCGFVDDLVPHPVYTMMVLVEKILIFVCRKTQRIKLRDTIKKISMHGLYNVNIQPIQGESEHAVVYHSANILKYYNALWVYFKLQTIFPNYCWPSL